MKEYIKLYKEKDNRYYTVNRPNPPLWYLNYFLENDFSSYKESTLTEKLNHYDITYIYNDLKNKMMHIGFAEWSIDEEINSPDEEEFSLYLNETNNCKISIKNFNFFIIEWVELKKQLPSFSIIYRDDNDWIFCKGFDSQEEMDLFVDDHTQMVH